MSNNVKLTDLIAPQFYDVYWDIKDGKHTYYDLFGGRGSTKSSFISLMIVLDIMEDPDANAVVFRKVAHTISTSVYEQMLWAIEVLGVKDHWRCITNPQKMIYKPTGQVIIFRGLDAAKKIKSLKVAKGYFKDLWFEELDDAELKGHAVGPSVRDRCKRYYDEYVRTNDVVVPRMLGGLKKLS